MCVGRGDARAYAKAGCCVLHIPGTGDYIRVYNEICAIYDRFDAWENALRDQLEQQDSFDYHALAITGARMLCNTIGMSDQFLRILFTTDQDASGNIRIAEGRYDIILLTIDEQITAICEKEKQLRTPYTSAFNHQGDIKPYCFNIFHLDLFAGCVFIYPDRHPFRDSDHEIADVFFRYFAKAFIKYIRTFESQERPAARVVRTLLLGQPLSREERHMLALDDRESWILFRLCQCESVRSMPPMYIQATIASLMPRTAHVNLDSDDITGISKVKSDVPLESCTSFASFRSIVSQMGYAAGLSNPFRVLNAIGEYRFQADYALRFLQRTKKRQQGVLLLQRLRIGLYAVRLLRQPLA